MQIAYDNANYDPVSSPGTLRYAHLPPGGAWRSTVVDTLYGFFGMHASIAIDGSNRAHISYSKGGELVHAAMRPCP